MFHFVLGAEGNILGLKIVLKIPIISLIEAKQATVPIHIQQHHGSYPNLYFTWIKKKWRFR
jgi:hypothetical protein